MLGEGLALIDAENTACHLYTSDPANIDYYQRWGSKLTQPGFSAGASGPTYYGMTRPASRSSAGAPTIVTDVT